MSDNQERAAQVERDDAPCFVSMQVKPGTPYPDEPSKLIDPGWYVTGHKSDGDGEHPFLVIKIERAFDEDGGDLSEAFSSRVAILLQAAFDCELPGEDGLAGLAVLCRRYLDAWNDPTLVDTRIVCGSICSQIACVTSALANSPASAGLLQEPQPAGEPEDKLVRFVRDLNRDPLAVKSQMLEKFRDQWSEVAGYVSAMVGEGSRDARRVLDLMYELRPATRVSVEYRPEQEQG